MCNLYYVVSTDLDLAVSADKLRRKIVICFMYDAGVKMT